MLTTVSDGYLVLPESFVIGDLPFEEAKELVIAAGFTTDGLQTPCNLTLWQTGDATVLFDAGSGSGFMPSAGAVVASLEAIGLTPDDITHVVFTHGHPDHLWGALDDFDEPLFLNARHFFGEREYAYWTDPATVETIGAARQSFAAGASRRLELLGDGLDFFGGGDEVLPGIKAVSTPGHTPGHMSFRLSDGDNSVLVVGDAIGNAHLALARPQWVSPADQDAETGIATRLALLEELSSSQELMVGFHLTDGGIGRIGKEGDVFTFNAD
jgi:glyoxylase-like metal-dependent hydrolase (beta-lactamase superfamily II)